ncbi:hypothetical protein D3C76_1611720 [compost metagenome]
MLLVLQLLAMHTPSGSACSGQADSDWLRHRSSPVPIRLCLIPGLPDNLPAPFQIHERLLQMGIMLHKYPSVKAVFYGLLQDSGIVQSDIAAV